MIRHAPVVIASHNGLECTRTAHRQLSDGIGYLDALVAGVEVSEDDPAEYTVGYGGLPNEQGVVELDAAIMDGPRHRGGAVAALRDIRHPTRVARQVMEQTNRVLLVGEGAREFAVANGHQPECLLTESARKRWLHWRRTRSKVDDWLPPPEGGPMSPGEFDRDFLRPTGTVHVALLTDQGQLACATSTSGHAFKLPGRVGDSPILGAGLYCDNEVGTCGSIGWGEANQQHCSSFAVVELMRQGASPADATREAVDRVIRRCPAELQDENGRPRFNLRLFALAATGEFAATCIWAPQQFAVTDANGTRHEACAAVFA